MSYQSKLDLIPRWPFIMALILILLAIPPVWPYGYDMLLRLVVCGGAVYGAVLLGTAASVLHRGSFTAE